MEQATAHSVGTHNVTLRSYTKGFVLALLLTIISFGLVMEHAFRGPWTIIGLFAAAIAQILVHLHYFLHLDASSEQRGNVFAFVFTVVIIGILVGGSMWIMINTHSHVMR